MNKIKTLSAYLEVSLTSPKKDEIKRFIKMLSLMGYQEFYMGLTDAYKLDNYPYFNYKRGYYSKADLKEIDDYAYSLGVTVVPAIQVLGHLEFIWRHQSFRDFMDTRCILEVGNPKAYEFVDAMVKTISSSFRTNRIHVGMDETFGIGTGEYLKHNGPKDKKALVLEYLKEVCKIAKKYNTQIEIWGDMLLESEGTSVTPEMVKKELPDNTLVWQWNYDVYDKVQMSKKITDIQKHADNVGFAGCAWRHISYVTSNEYSIPRLVGQIKYCAEYGINNYMVTIWGDNNIPSSIYSALPSLFIASEYNQGFDVTKRGLNKAKFKQITNIEYDEMMQSDYLNNPLHHDRKVYYNNFSFVALFSDLLIGNVDLIIKSEGLNEAYRKLSRKYKNIAKKNEDYKEYFSMLSSYALILSIKLGLGSKLREAYWNKDKATLTNLVNNDLTKLIKISEKFINEFYVYGKKEFQSLGLEQSYIYHAAIVERFKYSKNCFKDFIDKDIEIDELRDKTLPPDYSPQVSDDVYLLNWHPWLMSYTMK